MEARGERRGGGLRLGQEKSPNHNVPNRELEAVPGLEPTNVLIMTGKNSRESNVRLCLWLLRQRLLG